MRFCTSYGYKDKVYCLIIDANNWQDAEERCLQLNLKLDGQLIEERPAGVISNTKEKAKFKAN